MRWPLGASRSAVVLTVGLVALGLGLGGCSSSPARPNASRTATGVRPPPSDTRFAGPGPYAAGTDGFTLHGDRVVVWYPAAPSSVARKAKAFYHLRSWLPPAIASVIPKSFPDRVAEDAYANVPMAPGRFPVVLFSHGYGGYPDQSTFLTTKLAEWGFIVVAPDQTARDLSAVVLGKARAVTTSRDVAQQKAALAEVFALSDRPRTLFFDHVVREAAIVGHSAGGYTAVATAESDPAISVVVTMAGVPVPRRILKRPLTILVMAGSRDKVVPSSQIVPFYRRLPGIKGLLVIDGVGHNAFDDVCTIARSRGGVVAAARALNLPVPPALLALATDGCKAPDLYPPKAWPLIEQATVAELRYGFGFDPTPVGLGSGLDRAFHGVAARYIGVG